MNTLKAMTPSPEEAAIAKTSSQELSAFIETKAQTQALSIYDAAGVAHEVNLLVSALRLLVNILIELGEGNSVKLVPVHAELTTQEGADLLNISRPTFVKLFTEKNIPFSYIGNRRKVKYADVRPYQKTLDKDRLATLDKLSELDQELGLAA